MKKTLFLIISTLLTLHAHAGVSVESGCYQQTPKSGDKNIPFFFFQSYYDNDLLENVGAFVSYNNSKNRISLVFYDEMQGEGPNEGEYQKFWLEVVGKSITGQYVEHGNYSGNPGGKYIKYTRFKTNRVTTFRAAMIDRPCTAGH